MSSVKATILSTGEISSMKEKIETLLSTKGVTVDHPKVLDLLAQAG
ncbi:MAG: hypothetical protein H6Q65_2835, partial [Firmicutes bacterium]|nr:hypothetical protein [Bacillota bacterium]